MFEESTSMICVSILDNSSRRRKNYLKRKFCLIESKFPLLGSPPPLLRCELMVSMTGMCTMTVSKLCVWGRGEGVQGPSA